MLRAAGATGRAGPRGASTNTLQRRHSRHGQPVGARLSLPVRLGPGTGRTFLGPEWIDLAQPGSCPRGLGRGLEPDPILPSIYYSWGLGEGLVVSSRWETLVSLGGTSLPSLLPPCRLRTHRPGRVVGTAVPGQDRSPTAPSRSFGRNAAHAGPGPAPRWTLCQERTTAPCPPAAVCRASPWAWPGAGHT